MQKLTLASLGTPVYTLIALAIAIEPAQAAIEEITVTARKREENLQELPMSITAIDAESMQKLGVRDLKDVTYYTPGVDLDSGFGLNDQRLVIRGLSPSRGRPNSAILVDGIDLTTESVSTAGGSMFFNARLLDIERVEVVKGPQSALYGRAAFTGAIQYVTRDPSEEFEVDGGFDIGDYGRQYVNGGVSGAVTKDFGVRVNAMAWNDDGFYEEGFTGSSLGGGDGYGVSLTGKWAISDTFTARARASYSEDNFDQQATFFDPVNTTITPPANSVGVGSVNANTIIGVFTGAPQDAKGRTSYLTANPVTGQAYEGGNMEVLNTSLRLGWDVLRGEISSYTGYAKGKASQILDGDFDVRANAANTMDVARGGTEINFSTDTRMFSQELRYASAFNSPVQFTVGALYWQEQVEQTELGISVISFPFGPTAANRVGGFNEAAINALRLPSEVDRTTDSISAYGLIEWNIVPSWKLSFEGRYARETMEVRGAGCEPSQPLATFRCSPNTTTDLAFQFPIGVFAQSERNYAIDSVSDNYFTPRVSLEWIATENVLAYASVSKGIKPGGISTISAGSWLDVPYNNSPSDGNLIERKFSEETLIAYEIGAKTMLWDKRVLFNTAFFLQNYSDKQIPVQQLNGQFLVTSIENAGDAQVYGAEVEVIWQTTENTRLQVGYSYIHGEYTRLEYGTTSGNSIARAGNCTLVPNPGTGSDLCQVSLKGNAVEDVPEHSVVAMAGYYPPFGQTGLTGLLEGDMLYQSKRYNDEFNDSFLKDYSIFNVRLGVQTDRWDAILYVNNVLDDDTIKGWSNGTGLVATAERTNPNLGAFPADGFGMAPPPRHWGVRANVRF